MISKELFLKTFEQIKQHRENELNLSSVLESMTDGCICDTLIFSRYEDLVVSLLEEFFDTTLISYYIYELEFGERWYTDCVSDIDEANALKSIDSLYEYLLKKLNK